MMKEVTVRREDALDRCEKSASEERLARVTATPLFKDPNVLRNKDYGFFTLLRGSVLHVNRRMNYRDFLSR